MIDLDTEPKYYGKNIIRYESFVSDFNELLSDENIDMSVIEILSFLIEKFELKNLTTFNIPAYTFLMTVYDDLHIKLLNRFNKRKDIMGEEEKCLQFLRDFKDE